MSDKNKNIKNISEPVEGEDYYINSEGNLVFTKEYHLKRGYCCESGCLHCPYGFKKDQEGN